jgi:CheY-like chemotaxis protein
MMIVDDNRGDRELWHLGLEQIGWNADLIEASSASQAIDILKRQALQDEAPDILILDFRILGQTCVPLLDDLRAMKHYAHLPIIVMSGSKLIGAERDLCLQRGVVKVLVKPDTMRALERFLQSLKTILEGHGDISRGGSWIGAIGDVEMAGNEN